MLLVAHAAASEGGPVDSTQPLSSLAYMAGERAAARMAEVNLPIRFASDSWGEYLEHGAIGTLRCVDPRPVMPDLRARSTVRYGAPETLAQRVWELAHGPTQFARRAYRLRIAGPMHRTEIVD